MPLPTVVRWLSATMIPVLAVTVLTADSTLLGNLSGNGW